jgi:hypothetical protein
VDEGRRSSEDVVVYEKKFQSLISEAHDSVSVSVETPNSIKEKIMSRKEKKALLEAFYFIIFGLDEIKRHRDGLEMTAFVISLVISLDEI